MAFRSDRSALLRYLFPAIAVCALLLSGCKLGCLFLPCDGMLQATVLVRDSAGAPINGAHVVVLDFAAESHRNGCARVQGVFHPASVFSDPDVTLLVERTGYKTLHEHKRMGTYRIEVTLQPADSSKPSSAVWSPARSGMSLACR